jgi:hypothetical protein
VAVKSKLASIIQSPTIVRKKTVVKSYNPSGKNSPLLSNPEKIVKPVLEGKNVVRKFAFATRAGYNP